MCERWWLTGTCGEVMGEDEVKESILFVSLGEGYLVEYGDDLADQKAFTDRVDAAEWLLGWLGFEDEIVEDILEGLWDDDELYSKDDLRDNLKSWHPALFESVDKGDADELYNILSDCVAGVDYDELDEDGSVDSEHERVLDVARAALAYVENRKSPGLSAFTVDYDRLVQAVKKWRGEGMIYRTNGGPCTWEWEKDWY